jgi:hypothetical protein
MTWVPAAQSRIRDPLPKEWQPETAVEPECVLRGAGPNESPETSRPREVDAHVRRRLRDGGNHPRDAVRDDIRQRPRFLFRHLRSRGASIKAAAGVAFSGRGRLFCLNRPRLKRAYPPGWFSGKLVPLAAGATGSVHRLVASLG